jgi:oxalate decarboxylase/phosphoglucose isomerase-like protein (cupin superfamily)
MNTLNRSTHFDASQTMSGVFSDSAKALFAFNYPETPHILRHQLRSHPLLDLEALADLADGLPKASVEYNLGDLPIGIAPEDVPHNGMSIGETIRKIASVNSWAVIKNVEQDPAYNALLLDLLGELRPIIEQTTGAMLRPQGFIFISSPGSMTPYHFDPEHNILLQIAGTKTMTVFPAGDTRFAPAEAHEQYHTGGPRNLVWNDAFKPYGSEQHLEPGDAVFVPVMAPHFVRNGDAPSLSLSITWRSDWSFAESEAHAFNHLCRKIGLNLAPPKRYPAQNRLKSLTWKALRKAHIVQ